MATNKRAIETIAKKQKYLCRVFDEDSVFISRATYRDKDQATVILAVTNPQDEGEAFLSIRRLLEAFRYRVNKETEFQFDYTLKRRKEG